MKLDLKFKKLFYGITAVALLSCGEEEQLIKPEQNYSTLDAAARETDIMKETDLSKMSGAELTRFLTVLKERNKKEAREIKILAEINAGLCKKLADVKKSCTALAPLMSGSYDKLKCSKEELSNEIEVTSSGRFKLVGDNLYESTSFEGANQKISFASKTGAKNLDIRFIDLSELILQSEGGSSSGGFELSVNGVTMFTAGDLESAGGNSYRIKLTKFLEISKSSDCNVKREEIDEIRRAARAKHGEL